MNVENKDNWKWFIERLQMNLGIGRGAGWTFISDQCKVFHLCFMLLYCILFTACTFNVYAYFFNLSFIWVKGLMPAIYKLFPDSERRWCARHLFSNWRKKHKGNGLEKQYWICIKSPNKAEFKLRMEALADISQKAHDDMIKFLP